MGGPLRCFRIPFSEFQPLGTRWSRDFRDLQLDADSWTRFRAWAIIRCTGRWPLAVYGGHGLPHTMACCPLCWAEQIGVDHPLLDCPGTLQFFAVLQSKVDVPPRERKSMFLHTLFSMPMAVVPRASHIQYVNDCLACILNGARDLLHHGNKI